MIVFPNAKINLGLNVVGKRHDGYHNIETIFYPVPVNDALEIVAAKENETFTQEGIRVEAEATDNLVIRALRLLREEYSVPPLDIYLMKAIPFGAGLGGGSSDAAFMLKLVNQYCDLGITDEQLEELAARIGADCPFFIRNTPVFASGIGNVFTPVPLSLAGYYFCLVKPDIMVSTPEAYSLMTPRVPSLNLREIVHRPVSDWRGLMVNDFEKSVFSRYPEIEQTKMFFYERGATYSSMSGSGSSVFALFDRQPEINLNDKFPNWFTWEGML